MVLASVLRHRTHLVEAHNLCDQLRLSIGCSYVQIASARWLSLTILLLLGILVVLCLQARRVGRGFFVHEIGALSPEAHRHLLCWLLGRCCIWVCLSFGDWLRLVLFLLLCGSGRIVWLLLFLLFGIRVNSRLSCVWVSFGRCGVHGRGWIVFSLLSLSIRLGLDYR